MFVKITPHFTLNTAHINYIGIRPKRNGTYGVMAQNVSNNEYILKTFKNLADAEAYMDWLNNQIDEGENYVCD